MISWSVSESYSYVKWQRHFPAMSFWEKSSWQNLDLQVQYISLWDFCARINYYTHCHQLQKQDRDVACQGSQLALRPLEKKMSSILLVQWTEPEDKAHYEGLFLAANSHKYNNSRGRHWPHSEMSQFSTLLSELYYICDIVLNLFAVSELQSLFYMSVLYCIFCLVCPMLALLSRFLAANTICIVDFLFNFFILHYLYVIYLLWMLPEIIFLHFQQNHT